MIGILQQEHDDGHTHTLLQRLNDIPGDLNELFGDILTRDSRHKAEVLLCIQWVLFAKQPLQKEQLYVAIRIGINPNVIPFWDSDPVEDADIRRFILSSSKGLVEISESKRSHKVQFIHESVREFFFKEDFTRFWPELKGNFRGESHERLKQCCLYYMKIGASQIPFKKEEPRKGAHPDRATTEKKFPLLEYTFRNILHHAEEAAAGGINQEDFLQSFDIASWVQCESIFEQFASRRHEPTTSLLYILAEHDASSLINYHNDKLYGFREEDFMSFCRYSMPILAAIATNSHKAVYALLKAQADTEPPTSVLRTLCEQYAQNKNKRIFTMREFKFSKNRSLLSNFFHTGEDLVVLFLLVSPPTLNTNIARGRKENSQILRDAILHGREFLVRQLLDEGVDVDMRDKCGVSVLWHAVNENYPGIVQLLLDRKANVEMDIEASMYGIRSGLLRLAAMQGHVAIMQLFLRHDININVRFENNKTVLHYATERGHFAMVQLLLDKGAEIEAKTDKGATPLLTACWGWVAAVVRVLLDNGANIEATDNLRRTPLTVAIARMADMSEGMKERRLAVVKLLLDGGANVHAAYHNGNTPLSKAKRLPSDDPVKPLVLAKRIKREVTDSKVVWLDVIEILDD